MNNLDVDRLQDALDTLVHWAEIWQLFISIDKCCILSIGKVCVDNSFHIDSNILPIVGQCRDLGVIISHDLQSSEHINTMVAKAHQRTNAILRCFVSRDVNLLAYVT